MPNDVRLDIPLALVVLAFFLITAFQTEQLVREHNALQALQRVQETTLTQASAMRAKFQMLAAETEKLAQAGDPGAKAVLSQLSEQGITIRPGATASTTP
jgi:hypothetical protein